MALESATYISDLNVANPAGTDEISRGDDHIRLIKAAIKATFPSVAGEVTLSHTEINALDTRLDAIEAAYVKKDGTVTMTGNLAMGDNKVTGLATPTADADAATKEYVDDVASGGAAARAALYPVGSLYMNASNSTNPASLLGFGTWTAFGQGRVLIGAGTVDDGTNQATYNAGTSGGFLKRALTAAMLPQHTHKMFANTIASSILNTLVTNSNVAKATNVEGNNDQYVLQDAGATGPTLGNTGAAGSASPTAFDIVQPYVTVYIWRRTA